jgi:hypothetical protein
MSINEEFKQELHTLLKKYNAYISFDYSSGSDIAGICDPSISIYVENTHTLLFSCTGYELDIDSLERRIPLVWNQ